MSRKSKSKTPTRYILQTVAGSELARFADPLAAIRAAKSQADRGHQTLIMAVRCPYLGVESQRKATQYQSREFLLQLALSDFLPFCSSQQATANRPSCAEQLKSDDTPRRA
ncbi:MAG: hypothetical protein OXI77_08350 [Chloroflexota bacterium]|nr:hypothetical protein [Chloroflexota bacterium]MDE2910688.1 hypothetical protein [Chloroflexota bacterium]